jgi:hypothetical protein
MSNATYYTHLDALIRAEAGLSDDTPIYFRRRPLIERVYPIQQWSHRHSNRFIARLVSASDSVWCVIYLWQIPVILTEFGCQVLKLRRSTRQTVRAIQQFRPPFGRL